MADGCGFWVQEMGRLVGLTAFGSGNRDISWYINDMRWLCCLIALVGLLPIPARAAPTVTVTGRTILRLTSVQRSARGIVRIAGDLRDADLLTGIEGKRVLVEVDVGRQGFVNQRVRTGKNGRFTIQWPLPLGTYPVTVHFAGDRMRENSSIGPVDIDVSKLSLSIEFKMPRRLDAAAATQQIQLEASVDREPVVVDLTLFLKGQSRPLRTGANGRGSLTVPTKLIGQLGPATLLARFLGDDRFNPTSARHELLLVSAVKLDAKLAKHEIAADGRIELSGTVSDLRGPIVGGTISLHALDRHRLSALTNTQGAFAFSLAASTFPPGQLELDLRYAPPVLWRKAASRKIQATILAPRPIPVGLYAAPPLATLVLLAALLLLRFRQRLRRRQTVPDVSKTDTIESEPLPSGLQLSSRSRLRQLLAPDFGLAGVVWDGAEQTPVAGARIHLTGPEGSIALLSDDHGAFAAEGLAAGKYSAEVSQVGYVSERFALQLPHRGNLRGLRVVLVPVRIRILEIYRGVALPMLPKRRLWALWTPRELLTHARHSGYGSPPFDQLTTLLENVYWGPLMAPESSVDRAHGLARNCPRLESSDRRDANEVT